MHDVNSEHFSGKKKTTDVSEQIEKQSENQRNFFKRECPMLVTGKQNSKRGEEV